MKFNFSGVAGWVPEPECGGVTSPRSWPSPQAGYLSAWGPAAADPTPAVMGGADARRTLLIPLGVELLNDLCTAVNLAFNSGIFFTAWRVFLFGVAAVGGLECR